MNVTDSFIEKLFIKSRVIPDHVIEQSKKCLLDYLGVKIGGRKYVLEIIPELKESFYEEESYKALFDGFCSHVLELDDGHRFGMIHLGASIITAILVVAQKEHLDAMKILSGIVMGYEAAVSCARALQPGHKERGYHVSGTCGTIGSAIGVAFALGYDKEQLKSTLACAVSSAAGLLEIQEDSSALKPYNLGRAAMDGVAAARVGQLALIGPDDVLGGKKGFLSALTDTPHTDQLTAFTSDDYAIEGIYQKKYAACRHCHPAIDAALSIRNDSNQLIEQVEKVDVYTYKLAIDGHNHTSIKGMGSAKLSIPYAVALAIIKGSAGYADFNEDNMVDDEILSLTRKVTVIEDEKLTNLSPTIRGAWVVITLSDNSILESTCLYPKGEPENPLSRQELEDKFRGLATYGGLTSNECEEVINEVWKDDIDLKRIMNIVSK